MTDRILALRPFLPLVGLCVLLGTLATPASAQWDSSATKCTQGGYALVDCLSKELETADKALNAAYKKMEASISADPDTKPEDKKDWLANLVAAQRAWLAYRDTNCKPDLIGAEWHFGSGTTAAQQICVLWMTKQRTEELLKRFPLE